ncbi:hypothetical protein [Fictibacillus sp. NRS-1165]|uniref:hypothetical protein n=1 Tax=Fictibacillus sp. NRS-1165 TaxID=3144463 RepID=UPI003D231D82
MFPVQGAQQNRRNQRPIQVNCNCGQQNPTMGAMDRNRPMQQRPIQVTQNCNCGRGQSPTMGAMDRNRPMQQRPIQVTQNCNCGRGQSPTMGAMDRQRPRCRRFCENVCHSLFGRRRQQCIEDCLACRDDRGNVMGTMDDNDSNWRSPGNRGDVMGVQSDMNDGHYWDYEF